MRKIYVFCKNKLLIIYLQDKHKDTKMFKKEESYAYIYLAVTYFIAFTIPSLINLF